MFLFVLIPILLVIGMLLIVIPALLPVAIVVLVGAEIWRINARHHHSQSLHTH